MRLEEPLWVELPDEPTLENFKKAIKTDVPLGTTLFMVVLLPERSGLTIPIQNFLNNNKMPCIVKEVVP